MDGDGCVRCLVLAAVVAYASSTVVYRDDDGTSVLSQQGTALEWYDPMDEENRVKRDAGTNGTGRDPNPMDSEYLRLSAEMAAMNPPPGYDPAGTEASYYSGYRPGRATNTHSCNHIRRLPSNLRSASVIKPRGLSQFYQKYTEAYGIPIVGSNRAGDSAMKRACYVVRFLFADHTAVRQSYYARSGRMAVIGTYELTTNIPEHSWLPPWWNTRARGLGATDKDPVATCGEENFLCGRTDKWHDEDIGIHEYAHGVHLLGAKYAIRGWQARLLAAYNAAKYSGRWRNTYSMSTADEYFAEGAQSYFDCNPYYPTPNGVHGPINKQYKLRTYDPTLFQLVREVFPCNNTYLLRCKHSRATELAQNLRMNCNEGGGVTSSPTGGGGGGGGATTASPSVTTRAPPTGNCRDNNSRCGSWAQRGECDRNPAYMHVNCKRSCNRCSGGGGGGGSNCSDQSQHCSYWQRTGECTRNPTYMNESCKRSCNQC